MRDIIKKLSIKDIGMEKLLLIAAAGIILIISSFWGTGPRKREGEPDTSVSAAGNPNGYVSENEYISMMEEKLKKILEGVDGIGSVNVMITYKSSSEKIVLSEKPYAYSETNEEDGKGGKRKTVEKTGEESVILNGSQPYVTKEFAPQIQGVAVVAKGGGNPLAAEKINNIVKALFDIPANKIAVTEKKN